MDGSADELAAWLRLTVTPGVARDAARRLLAAFGSADAIFRGEPGTWRTLVGPAGAQALGTPPEFFEQLVPATLAWLGAAADRRVVALGEPGYPPALLETADPPLLLHLQGRIELLGRPSVAIVGSRQPTPQGLDHARRFGRELAAAGWVVVSGMARGIDGAAHEGALAAEGDTIAVVGTGLDRVYPAQHRKLAHLIGERGLLVSEYPLGTPALPFNFLERNRLIAGLSQGTLVVEAALRSGSLTTARLAGECGREVMAVPGSIASPQSRGCHALIRQGAKLIETSQDVIDELRQPAAVPPAATRAAADRASGAGEDPLLQALGYEPATLDALQQRTGEATARLQARLLELELAGRVARLPGGLWQRRVET